MSDSTSTDPRVFLDNIELEEVQALKKLKNHEARVRVLLAELKALRALKEQAIKRSKDTDSTSEDSVFSITPKDSQDDEDLKSIDDLVDEVKASRAINSDSNSYQVNEAAAPLYNVPRAQDVTIASDDRTIDRLYEVAANPNPSSEDKKWFFDTANSVLRSNNYEMNQVVQERVTNTYAALKSVLESRPELASDYKPKNPTSNVNTFLQTLKKSPVSDYKLKKN
jgi:hypothetical protein